MLLQACCFHHVSFGTVPKALCHLHSLVDQQHCADSGKLMNILSQPPFIPPPPMSQEASGGSGRPSPKPHLQTLLWFCGQEYV